MVNIILIITPSLSHDNYTANNNQLKNSPVTAAQVVSPTDILTTFPGSNE